MEAKDEQHDPGIDEPNGTGDFLVGEETENVKPTGVDDKSTGMGDDDYLGKTNRKGEEGD
ncbi:hypothetical protein EXU85_10550 [Spirosoma sp. KCTC 42546]|uniref:hypothetical protein n=1 Tax=Spirosoma sp. KCTC 42546 TaxID=2520506 RepID=UPI0011590AFF|nr:hypothetical protein [Spirosoma sp. KCTC 42546]QDK79023.1 hypothetical protein EXU85_10550 [Spirosoma sp. KCTC 42546]